MNKRNKLLVVILVLAIAVVSFLSIFLYNKEHRVEEIKKEAKDLVKESASFSDFKEKLSDAELDVSDEFENTECEMIGASEGYTYLVSTQEIQVYRFDFNKSDEITIKNLKLAQEEGKVVIPAFNNVEIKVVYNKGLILIENEDHEDWDLILEAFNKI